MKLWSLQEEVLLKKMFEEGIPYEEMSKKLHRDVISIKNKGNRSGLKRKKEDDALVKFEIILEEVSYLMDINMDKVLVKTRKREIIRARQMCHFLAHKMVRCTYAEVGEYFGNKDHATVSHSIKTMENDLSTDYELYKIYVKLKVRLNNRFLALKNSSKYKIEKLQQLKIVKSKLNINEKIILNDLINKFKNERTIS